MERRKIMGAVASIPLTLVLLTGCGIGGNDEPDEPSASQEEDGGGVREPGEQQPSTPSTEDPDDNEEQPETSPPEEPTDSPSININPSESPTSEPSEPSTEPSEPSESAPPSTDPSAPPSETNPPNDGDGGNGDDDAPEEPPYVSIGHPDGTVLFLNITADSKIYNTPSATGKVIGDAKSGGSFKGTVTTNGEWIKIDRSPGYIHASNLSVDKVIKK